LDFVEVYKIAISMAMQMTISMAIATSIAIAITRLTPSTHNFQPET
jgi:hypothetical protein